MYVDPHLPRQTFGWYSSRLGLEMPIVNYGEQGRALLLYPTAEADYLEHERFLLIKALEPQILAGKIRVFSINSVNRHGWLNPEVTPAEAARWQARYSSYVEEEVVAHIRQVIADPTARIAVSGAGFGAFHAANQFFRRPDIFNALVAMSGFFDLEPAYSGNYRGDDLYFNNPVSYIANLCDEHTLELLRCNSQIHIVSGQGLFETPQCSKQLSQLLLDKGIPHNLDLWGHDVNHDWVWWRKMLPYYVAERLCC